MAVRARAQVAAVGGALPAGYRILVDWGDRSEPSEIRSPVNSADHWFQDARTFTIRAQAYTRDFAKIGGPGSTAFNAGAPFLSACVPAFGPEAGGTPCILEGGNLSGPTAVLFGSAQATNIQLVSAAAISCLAPPGVGLVNVAAVAPTGTNTVQYEYRAAEEPDNGGEEEGAEDGG
jgi:IPT/TIG domain